MEKKINSLCLEVLHRLYSVRGKVTSNRLERFFEELKRRIRVFRRFPNTKSCSRWLYALITELDPYNLRLTNYESQQSS